MRTLFSYRLYILLLALVTYLVLPTVKMVTVTWYTAVLVLLVAVLRISPVYSYSAGAREESCYNMEAAHVDTISGSNRSSTDCFQFGAIFCPFSLEVVAKVDYENDRTVIDDGEITTYECDEVYEGKQQLQATVFYIIINYPHTTVLVTTSQNQFEGYMLEARATTESGDFEETSTIWGEWLAGPSDPYHSVDCNRNRDSTEAVVVRT